jgi:opacity protein-like surface antigen
MRPVRRTAPFAGNPGGSVFPAGSLLASLLILFPGIAAAQNAPDFAIGEPRVSVGAHIGYGAVLGRSDLFSDTRALLTVGERDLDGPVFRGEVTVRLSDRLDFAAGLGHSRGEVASEFRDWVDVDDLPIEQTTSFFRTPVTVGARYYLADRGMRVGQFAWIPAPWTPYVGAGGGFVAYSFTQKGDWVDFSTQDIFRDTLEAEGTAATLYLALGSDFTLNPHVVLNGEARYHRGRGDVGRDFVGFDPIDLSGVQFTVGLAMRF